MAILLESAAAAAGDTDRPGGGDGLIDFLVEFQDTAMYVFRHGSPLGLLDRFVQAEKRTTLMLERE
jgi:hypothetical protein